MLRGRLGSPGSTSGLVAERCKQGLATRQPYAGDGQATARAELAWLLGLTKDLSEVEDRCCAVRYGGGGGLVEYEAMRRSGDVRAGDGEVIIDAHPDGPDGQPLGEPWVRVRGWRERLPSYAEVADSMAIEGWRNGDGDSMSPGAVEKLLRTASEKIATAIRARLAMATWEERASG